MTTAKSLRRLIVAGAAGFACLLAGCSAAPEKMLETSSLARKKPRPADASEMAAVSKPTLSQACAQRHVDYQAGRNQPSTLEQKQAMDAACAGTP